MKGQQSYCRRRRGCLFSKDPFRQREESDEWFYISWCESLSALLEENIDDQNRKEKVKNRTRETERNKERKKENKEKKGKKRWHLLETDHCSSSLCYSLFLAPLLFLFVLFIYPSLSIFLFLSCACAFSSSY